MKTRIEVANRKEAELIRRGLEDKATRALVKTMGTLLALPSNDARRRVLNFITDKFGLGERFI